MNRLLIILGILLATLPANAEDGIAFFEKKIRPLLAEHCYRCHSAETESKGDLLLDSRDAMRRGGSRGPALIPGNPDESLILRAIRHETLDMPRKAQPLPAAAIADLEEWIAMGAPDPREETGKRIAGIDWEKARSYWAFQPLKVESPEIREQKWARTEIDRYILAKIEEKALKPAPDAAPETLLRRLSFDLVGLPPSPQEIRDFRTRVQDKDRLEALEAEVDRLLDSKEFGIYFARLWLDNVRYRTKNQNVKRYRDWVVDSFNADKPYDRFLVEHIAGDLLVAPEPDGTIDPRPVIGTAALALATGGCDTTERQIELIGQSFLGMTMACARCHDHKFDPFSQEDYYALAGILQSSEIVGDKGGGIPLLTSTAEKETHEADRALELALRREYEELRKRLPNQVKLIELQERLARDDNSRARKQFDELLEKQKKEGWDLDPPEAPRIRELIEERRAISEKIRQVPVVLGMQEGKIRDIPVLRNGEKSQAGEIVPRRFPAVLAGAHQEPIGKLTDQSGRLELARWVASPDNPLTARVMANRVWLWLMGEGLVRTPNDFGKTGESPTHPELLDYLAQRLIDSGWSVKALAREIVLSHVYGLSIAASPEEDLLNECWTHARLRRLRYEQIVDALSTVAGDLYYDPSEEDRLMKTPPKDRQLRAFYYPGQTEYEVFDGADPDLLVDRRDESVTAPQLLYFLNSSRVRDTAAALAQRIEPLDETERLESLYLLCFGRSPAAAEIAEAQTYLETNSFERYCHALLCSNEFIYLR